MDDREVLKHLYSVLSSAVGGAPSADLFAAGGAVARPPATVAQSVRAYALSKERRARARGRGLSKSLAATLGAIERAWAEADPGGAVTWAQAAGEPFDRLTDALRRTKYRNKRVGDNTMALYARWLKSIAAAAHESGDMGEDDRRAFNRRLADLPRERPNPRGYMPLEEARRALAAEPPDACCAAYQFALLTGLRYSDTRRAREADTRETPEGVFLMVVTQKTAERIEVPLPPKARGLLRAWEKEWALMPRSAALADYRLERWCRRLGIGRVTFHTARHTYATMALEAGVPLEGVQAALGHRKISTTQRYAVTTRAQAARNAGLLAGLLTNP